jgi:N6-adenosine-specific RNA methylase IME4
MEARMRVSGVAVDITIDKEFAAMIPPLSAEERQQLEENIVEHGGARDPLVVWNEKNATILLDGHNRYEICTRHELPFDIHEMKLKGRDEAADWMDRNQLGRRNLHPDAFTLLLGRRYNRAKKAVPNPEGAGGKSGKIVGGQNVHQQKTADKLAKEHGVDEKTVRRAGQFAESVEKAKAIDPDIEAKVSSGKAPPRAAVVKAADMLEKSPERARQILEGEKKLSDVIRDEKRAEVVASLENVEARQAKELAGHYDVIVIDPPWPMEKIERDVRPNQTEFDYPTMSEDELAAMKMPAADACHLWLWTTHRFLPMAFRLLDAWGFKYVCTFVWHKPGGFQPIGLPQYNCEFAIYARRGSPQFIDTKAFSTCFDAARGKHSEKPEPFYDVIRRVTAGRRVDIFNRRQIDGFDTWGKESSE